MGFHVCAAKGNPAPVAFPWKITLYLEAVCRMTNRTRGLLVVISSKKLNQP